VKPALYGRIVFGVSAALFGVIALMWYDADTWQTLSWIWRLYGGAMIGGCLMIAQLAGGIGIQIPGTTRLASMVLCGVYSIFSMVCIPGILAAPAVYASYGSFFEQFSLLCGAVAVYAATEANPERAVSAGRVARLGLGVCAISFTVSQIIYPRVTASLVPGWIPPNQTFWAIFTTIAFGLAAAAILANRIARLALRLLTLMLALFGILVWIPRLAAHPEQHLNWSEFILTFLITGASWVVADSYCRRQPSPTPKPAG
jgi:hypothetical protein